MTKFKRIRLKLKLTQLQLAQQLGENLSTVINLERVPTDVIMEKMTKLLEAKNASN